jgi:3-hydroxybutyryl-CoA dehydratase
MKYKVGDKVSETKIFNKDVVEGFAKLTGDYNPIHFDEEYAALTIFKKPIVHGPLVLTLITTLFANKLPGHGAVYLSHDIKFIMPVYYDDTITAELKIIDITSKNHFIIQTTAFNQNNDVVIEGIARLKVF